MQKEPKTLRKFKLILFLLFCSLQSISQIVCLSTNEYIFTSYNSSTSSTDDPIYIHCVYNSTNLNVGTLMASSPTGSGSYNYYWEVYNSATNIFNPLTTQLGQNTSTLSNLGTGGYKVTIKTSSQPENIIGCYTAWIYVNSLNVNLSPIPPGCEPFNLGATINNYSNPQQLNLNAPKFTYYNPPPEPFIIGPTTSIEVCFDATHTFVSDLGFYLIGPPSCGSPVLTLSPNPQQINAAYGCCCNSGDNVSLLCFSTNATTTLDMCTGGPNGANMPVPLTGSFNAQNGWSSIYGCNAAQGGWAVQIYDCIGADVGALTQASIIFSGNQGCGLNQVDYFSGSIYSAINDNSCTPQTASIFSIPLSSVFSTPIIAGFNYNTNFNPNISFQWTNNAGVFIPNANNSLSPLIDPAPLQDVWFYLTVTDNWGCSIRDSVFFDYIEPVEPTINDPGIICITDNPFQLTADVPNGIWSGVGITNNTNGTFDPKTSGVGTFMITYITQDTCQRSTTKAITVFPQPNVEATIEKDIICHGTSTQLFAYGTNSYFWYPNSSISQQDTIAPIVNPLQSTTYFVIGTDANGCKDTNSVDLTVLPPFNIKLSADTTICFGDSTKMLELIVTGGNGGPYILNWTNENSLFFNNESSFYSKPKISTHYLLTVNDSCGTTPAFDSLIVGVNELPDSSFIFEIFNPCAPSLAVFKSNSTTIKNAFWDFGDGNYSTLLSPTHTFFEPDVFFTKLILTDSNNCRNESNKEKIEIFKKPNANFFINPENPQLPNAIVKLTSSSSKDVVKYFWQIEGLGNFEGQQIEILLPDTGIYEIQHWVENEKNCFDSVKYETTVLPNFYLYVPNTFTPNNDGLNEIFLPYSNFLIDAKFSFEIYNRWGEQVFKTTNSQLGWNGIIDGKPAMTGVYVWKLKLDPNPILKQTEFSGTISLLKY